MISQQQQRKKCFHQVAAASDRYHSIDARHSVAKTKHFYSEMLRLCCRVARILRFYVAQLVSSVFFSKSTQSHVSPLCRISWRELTVIGKVRNEKKTVVLATSFILLHGSAPLSLAHLGSTRCWPSAGVIF